MQEIGKKNEIEKEEPVQRKIENEPRHDKTNKADAQADLSLRCAQTHFVGFVMSRLK